MKDQICKATLRLQELNLFQELVGRHLKLSAQINVNKPTKMMIKELNKNCTAAKLAKCYELSAS